MITLTILTLVAVLIIVIAVAFLAIFGTAFIAIFGDFIVAFMVIMMIVKSVRWIKKELKKEKPED